MHVKYLCGGAALLVLGASTAFLVLQYVDDHSSSMMSSRGLGRLFAHPGAGLKVPLPALDPETVPIPETAKDSAGIGNPAEEATEPAQVENLPLKNERPQDIGDDDFDPDLRASRPDQNRPEQLQANQSAKPAQGNRWENMRSFPNGNPWGQMYGDKTMWNRDQRPDGGVAPGTPTINGDMKNNAAAQWLRAMAKPATSVYTYWDREVEMEPDPLRPDDQIPTLVGRILFFDSDGKDVRGNGSLTITLFDEGSAQGGAPVECEKWEIDSETLKTTFQIDAMHLKGYTVALPLVTDPKQLKVIRLDVSFSPETGDELKATSGTIKLK